MGSETRRGWAFKGGRVRSVNLPLAREATIEVDWGGGNFSVHGSPWDLEAFAAGHLVSEGFVPSIKEIAGISVRSLDDERYRIEVKVSGPVRTPALRRDNIVWGTDARPSPRTAPHGKAMFSPADFLALAVELQSQEERLRAEGPLHWAALYEGSSRSMLLASDLSRHSAMDKVIGKALLSNIPLTDRILYSSGRVGEEMAAKALRVSVGALVTRSVAVRGAVDLATREGLLLAGKLHANGFWVYSGRDRLRPKKIG